MRLGLLQDCSGWRRIAKDASKMSQGLLQDAPRMEQSWLHLGAILKLSSQIHSNLWAIPVSSWAILRIPGAILVASSGKPSAILGASLGNPGCILGHPGASWQILDRGLHENPVPRSALVRLLPLWLRRT